MSAWGALAQTELSEDATASDLTIHVVQRGETLFRIALSYGLTIDDLAALNGITNPNSIEVGQRLLVPVEQAPPEPRTHLVQPGENLRAIADLYGLSVEALAAQNELANPNRIYPGQALVIVPAATPASTITPSAAPTPAPTASPPENPVFHTVQRGETLFRIGLQYNLTVTDLVEANGLADPTRIFAGQQLLIPGVDAPQAQADLPPIVAALNVRPLIFTEGATGVITLRTAQPARVTGTFLERELRVIARENDTRHDMMIGVPMFTAADIYPVALTIVGADGSTTPLNFNVRVMAGAYGRQVINLSAEQMELLSPAAEDYEGGLLLRTTSGFTEERFYEGPMGLPAAAPMNAGFGARRSYNGSAFDRYHSGADFAGVPGTSVIAPAAGRVVLSDTLNIRGNTTILDHGWGIFTLYAHQTERYVTPGQFVEAGQIIGTIGSTGRVTGAHLHWELWVNGVPVNPMQWTREVFP